MLVLLHEFLLLLHLEYFLSLFASYFTTNIHTLLTLTYFYSSKCPVLWVISINS